MNFFNFSQIFDDNFLQILVENLLQINIISNLQKMVGRASKSLQDRNKFVSWISARKNNLETASEIHA